MSAAVLDKPVNGNQALPKQGRRRPKPPPKRKGPAKRKKKYLGRIYLGRDAEGKQEFEYVGHFEKKRERDQAVAKAKEKRDRAASGELPVIGEYCGGYLREYKRRNKYSSWDTTRERLKPFIRDFKNRRLDIARQEAKDWAFGEGRWEKQGPQRSGTLQSVVTLYNFAIDDDDLPLERRPFRGLGRRTRGRADDPPPTAEEFERLLDACSALGDYGPSFRAFMLFAAFTLMRPSELFMLKWTEIDAEANRIRKHHRLYRGDVDEPKYGKATIALTPPALEVVEGLPRRSEYVFVSKTGKRLSQPTISNYWAIVKAAAGLDFDFYHSTKHYGVHFLWRQMGVSRHAIAAQAGWSVSTIDKMLTIYGHGEVGALEELEEAWADTTITVPAAWVGSSPTPAADREREAALA